MPLFYLICASVLFLRFLITFTIISLSSSSGILPIYSSFVWYCGFLSCSFIHWLFLCLFTWFNFLCLRCPFHRLQGHSSFYLWVLPPVCGVRPVLYDKFLLAGIGACILVHGVGSCFSEEQCHAQWYILGCLWAWHVLWAARLLMVNFCFCFCLVWDFRHLSLLVFGCGQILVLRWRPLRNFSPINIP